MVHNKSLHLAVAGCCRWGVALYGALVQRELEMVGVRRVLLIMMLTGVAACGDNASGPTSDNPGPWDPHEGQMNLAILLLDYQTYALKGGNVSHYELCDNCDKEGLPFEGIYDPPNDFGSVTLVYTETGDTVFDATIVWNGTGRIRYPTTFLKPDTFNTERYHKPLPADVEYLSVGGRPTTPNEETLELTNRAWEAMDRLDIVHAYARKPYRVGFYMYAPRVGMFDPSKARWVVFLYRADQPAAYRRPEHAAQPGVEPAPTLVL